MNYKELKSIQNAEKRMRRTAEKESFFTWQDKLREKIPEKTMLTLEKAFAKAFSLIFEKGIGIIEKTYGKEKLQEDFSEKSYDELKKEATTSHIINTIATTVDGIGLGILGIGIPDIVIWVATLLRGVYETAVRYGYDYDSDDEKMFILKLIENAMTQGPDWAKNNIELDDFMLAREHVYPTQEELAEQTDRTARAFATEMLVMKFIQGIPIVGAVGGAANPVYYQKVMKYVRLKYHKRYLLDAE